MKRRAHNLTLPSGMIRCTGAATIVEAEAIEGAPPKRPAVSIAAYSGGPVSIDGWRLPVVIDLAGLTYSQDIPLLYAHDRERIIGQASSVRVENNALSITGAITGDSGQAAQVMEHARNGFRWRASIGVMPTRTETLKVGATALVNGRTITGPAVITRAGELRETSLLPIGADSTASSEITFGAPGATTMNFEAFVRAGGFDPATLTESQRSMLLAAFNAQHETGDDPADPPSSVDAVLAAAERDRQRIGRIANLTASALRDHPDRHAEITAMARAAEADAQSPEAYELELLRRVRRAPLSIHRPGAVELSAETIEAGLCLSGKLPGIEKRYSDQVLSAAEKRWRHGLGLGELLMLAAQRNGYHNLSIRDPGPLIDAAFQRPHPQNLAGGGTEFSSMDIGGILGNTANKFLTAGFLAIEQAWRLIASIRPTRDYKSMAGYALNITGDYDAVGDSGELTHASLSQTSYSNQAKLHGCIVGIPETAIVNDDLGALTQVPLGLGRGMAGKLNSIFWSAWLDDASFFPTNNSLLNYDSGADTALGWDALAAQYAAFGSQTKPNGEKLGVRPRILLTGASLEMVAWRLTMSPTLGDGATASNSVLGMSNPFASRLRPVATDYITSATNWYLVCDPAELSAIEVAFLNGAEAPIVETAQADFGAPGIRMRVKHSFGVAKQEFRAARKVAGA